jgi:predicted nucleotidyltransferase
MVATPDTLRLRGLAHSIVEAMTSRTALAAALLAGSAANGRADRFSDIDLLFYYGELPDPAAVREVLAGMGAERRRIDIARIESSSLPRRKIVPIAPPLRERASCHASLG